MRALPSRARDAWRMGAACVALGLALALYYFPSGLLPSLLGAAIFGGLCYLWPEGGTVWALFCAPLYRFPKAFDPAALGLGFLGRAEPLEFSLFEFSVLACFVAWLLRRLVERRAHGLGAGLRRLGAPALLLLLAATVSLLGSEFLKYSLREYRTVIIEPFFFYGLLLATTSGKGIAGPRCIGDAFVFQGGAMAVVSLWHYFFVGVVEATGGVRRLLAIYHSPNALALFLGRVTPFSIVLALASGGIRRWLYAAASALLALTLFFTYSRGAWLAVIGALALAAILRWGRKALLPLGLVALGLALLALLLPQGRLVAEASSLQRLYLWQAALAMIAGHPILGVGLDNFLYQYPGYMLPQAAAEPYMSHPHNIALDLWTRTGLLGLAAMLWLQTDFWRRAWRLLRRGEEEVQPWALGLAAAMAAVLLHGLIDNSFFLIDLAVVFWLIYGLLKSLDQ